MKKYFFFSAFIFSVSLFSQTEWSLEECIEYAKEHNIDVLKQQFHNKSIDEDITIAKGSYYPDANFSAFQGYNLGSSFDVSTGVGQLESRFNTFSLSSSVNLSNGFINKYKLQLAKLNSEKGSIDLDKLGLDLSLEIAGKYLLVLFNKEILSVAKEQESISAQEVNRLTRLYQAALKPKGELLEMESTYALDQKEVIIAMNNLENSLTELQQLLDIKIIENFDIETIDVSDFESEISFSSENEIYIRALEINPLLKSTQLNLDISNKNIQINKANFYPRLNFNYSYGSSYYHLQGSKDVVFNPDTGLYEDNGFFKQLNNNRMHYLGFTAIIPIFNRFVSRSNVDKSKLDFEIAQVELENQKKELKNKIEIAFNDVISAKAALTASELALISQNQAFSIAQKKYKEGLLTSYDFLISKVKYTKTQSELIKAKYGYLFKIKVLEYYE